MKLLRSAAFLSVLALSAAACGNRIVPLGPTGNPATQAVTVETFIGVLPAGGSRFYSFTVPRDGNVALALLSLVEDGEASAALVNLAIGVPRATDCFIIESRTIGVDVTPILREHRQAGVYCARISDVDTLTADATFAVNIIRPK